jgi:hypothetical protein
MAARGHPLAALIPDARLGGWVAAAFRGPRSDASQIFVKFRKSLAILRE